MYIYSLATVDGIVLSSNSSLLFFESEITIQKRVLKTVGRKQPLFAINTVRKLAEKLNKNQILEIRKMLISKIKQIDIGKKFEVCQMTISRINTGTISSLDSIAAFSAGWSLIRRSRRNQTMLRRGEDMDLFSH